MNELRATTKAPWRARVLIADDNQSVRELFRKLLTADGLRGDEVPRLAQIIGIVDVYDALTSRRSFREALTDDQAARHLTGEVEQGRFARQYVEAFLDSVTLARPTLAS